MLYLTDLQASVFSTGLHVERVFEAMELPQPRLVIKLLDSNSGVVWCEQRSAGIVPTERMDWSALGCNPGNTVFGMGRSRVREMERKELELEVFCKEYLIPLAAESNAIVLVDVLTECALASAFSRALRLVRMRYGEKLPFSILGVTTAIQMHNVARMKVDSQNVAAFFASNSEKWRDRLPMVEAAYQNHVNNPKLRKLPKLYMTPDISHYIVVEGVEEKAQPPHENQSERNRFEKLILNHLITTLPSIAIRTLRSGAPFPIMQIVDLVSMGVPVVFLDLKNRSSVTGEDREARLKASIEQFRKEASACHEDFGTDCFDTCNLAYFYDLLHGDGDPMTTHVIHQVGSQIQSNREWLFEAIYRKSQQDSDQNSKSFPTDDHIRMVVDALIEKDVEDVFFCLSESQRTEHAPAGDYQEIAISPKYRDLFRERRRAYQALLTNSNFHGANIGNPKGISSLINALTKLDRLPPENTTQGLYLLREAWDVVDVCMLVSGQYKLFSKSTFLLGLLITISTTSVTVVRDEIDNSIVTKGGQTTTEIIVFLLALSASVLGALVAFYSPAQRWRKIRGIASQLEAHIWQYRTRTMNYSQQRGNVRGPDLNLLQTIHESRSGILEAAGIDETSWSKIRKKHYYKHGQYEGSSLPVKTQESRIHPAHDGVPDLWDDHFSPLNPAAYVELRLKCKIRFYQKRLPGYDLQNKVCQISMIFASAVGAAISFLGFSQYFAIISASTSAIIAYLEFHSTANKLARYNSSISALQNLLSWWFSLSEIDRAALDTINDLVSKGESIIAGELSAWLSTPSASDKAGGNPSARREPEEKGEIENQSSKSKLQ